MSNPKELRNARRRADEAALMLVRIEKLPRRVGQSVRWKNDVVWTRIGDDAWHPEGGPDAWIYPSAHVATFDFEASR